MKVLIHIPATVQSPAVSSGKHRRLEATRVTPFAHLHIGTFAKSPQRPIFIITYSLIASFSAKERDTETGLLDFLDMPRTAAHEIGHSLGCSDYSFYRPSDLMVSGGFGSSITIRDIRSIMFMGGYDSLGETNAGGLGKCCDNLQLNDFMGKLIKK